VRLRWNGGQDWIGELEMPDFPILAATPSNLLHTDN
jgi:hypothetical protein